MSLWERVWTSMGVRVCMCVYGRACECACAFERERERRAKTNSRVILMWNNFSWLFQLQIIEIKAFLKQQVWLSAQHLNFWKNKLGLQLKTLKFSLLYWSLVAAKLAFLLSRRKILLRILNQLVFRVLADVQHNSAVNN